MRRQPRPFIVEVRQKRSHQKGSHSIWAGVDLSTAFAETARKLEEINEPSRELIDSNFVAVNAEPVQKEEAERHMVDPEQAESVEAAAKGVATPGDKKKTRRPRNAKAETRETARKNGATPSIEVKTPQPVRLARKVYSAEQRAQKLSQIEKLISGGATLRSAVEQAGTSEQTYYQWKKKAAAPAQAGDDLKDLLALEEENKRLRNLLAGRLRKENAELKKRLGLQ
ncbi:transposase [Mesorhizobium sp. CA8]|uniref:transposase n=1 Tax=unclassified Mesorhizobium TaxID=325217 RepID=UPI001CCD3D2C|nr:MULTISPECIES: transposase [unclassified Mesorhizobium]MBZ9761739.1 transposase [Mesorhizobium sp. CA8]MBZ9820508.1 transposase [Mesorhizobium sp. CA4]